MARSATPRDLRASIPLQLPARDSDRNSTSKQLAINAMRAPEGFVAKIAMVVRISETSTCRTRVATCGCSVDQHCRYNGDLGGDDDGLTSTSSFAADNRRFD